MNNNEFQLDPDLVYLNHAAVSPWPARSRRAVEQFAAENATRGAEGYPRWHRVEIELKEMLAQLINASSADDISLLKNTSEGLSVIAYGIEWRDGDNIVVPAQEFPSNRIVWESLKRFGVEVRLVDIKAITEPELVLINACDQNTRLMSVSSVQYADGFRMDLETIGAFCRENDTLFCVDAIQSLGALPFDLQKIGADFVVADGHKWMLGPEGLALFYTNPEIREQLRLRQYGWHMVASPGNYDRMDWKVSDTGTRFECGSPNMLGIHALRASLSLLLETGIEEVARRIQENMEFLFEGLGAIPELHLLSDRRLERRSGIVTFRLDDHDPDEMAEQLMSEGVICAARGGGIRFSPHYYTERQQLENALEKVRNLYKSPFRYD
jgi:selenocysteine lyase/cysteine desulfurase